MTRIEAEIPRRFAKEGPRDGIQGQAPEEVNRSVGVSAWLIWTGWGRAGGEDEYDQRGIFSRVRPHTLCVARKRTLASLTVLRKCVSAHAEMRS